MSIWIFELTVFYILITKTVILPQLLILYNRFIYLVHTCMHMPCLWYDNYPYFCNRDVRKMVGHQPEEFIIDCSYAGSECAYQ